jgi:hypothetical protein
MYLDKNMKLVDGDQEMKKIYNENIVLIKKLWKGASDKWGDDIFR